VASVVVARILLRVSSLIIAGAAGLQVSPSGTPKNTGASEGVSRHTLAVTKEIAVASSMVGVKPTGRGDYTEQAKA
jgi:hypothetical protein